MGMHSTECTPICFVRMFYKYSISEQCDQATANIWDDDVY